MNKAYKHIFSLLVVVAITLVFIPTFKVNAASSGTCGDNLSWTLDDEGTLTISGTGAMWDFKKNSDTPTWYDERKSINNVIISDGVTSIGNYAFYNCTNMESISIPDTVTSIGMYAFGFSGLTSEVIIPSGVTLIDTGVFHYCSNLTSITISNSVTSIEYNAFSGCSSLTSITIPDSVTSIDVSAFEDCSSLTNIIIPDSVTSLGACVFSGCSSLTNIPDGVASITSGMFSGCTGFKDITIPDSVTSIDYGAFSGCTNLTIITIPDSVTSIDDSAFKDCSSLTNIIIPDSVTSLGACVFSGCSSLTNIPDGVASITPGMFSGCTGFTDITIPDGITSIGTKAFSNCSSLTSITIPDSVTSIGEEAFYNCSSLTSITIPDSVTSIGVSAFNGCSSLQNISIPGSVVTINRYLFADCENLTSVVISEGIESIKIGAFMGCENLKTLILPSTVTYLSNNVFVDCDNLSLVVMNKDAYEDDTFWRCSPEVHFYYDLTVNGGSAENEAVYDSCTVTIKADIPEGKDFVKWEVVSGSVKLADETSATTTFTMPEEEVVVKATFKDSTYTVTYNTNGHGTAPAAQSITYDNKATKPSDLTADGFTFGGWYTDSACTKAYDFNSAVKADITLYAKWTAVSSGSNTANTYTVIEGGDGTWDGTSDYVIRVKSAEDDAHCIDRFLWAAVDGHELVVGKESEIASGSTIVTIKSDYLKTLSAGAHTIVVNFTDNSITTTITINNASANSGASIPATGEMQSTAMYVGIAMIAAACTLSVLVIKRRKEA